MIEIHNVKKRFEKIPAVREVSLAVEEGSVFGLLGTNGAGKSTLLRMMAGVLVPDEGEILLDGCSVWNSEAAKSKLFYISDDQYFFPNATPIDMARFYAICYPAFDAKKFEKLLLTFGLKKKRKIQTFSKGMKKQLSILLGVCTKASYLLCDETFDGLDPVMRQGVKSLFAREIAERQLTVVIASHNLREIEDICDYIGLLHKGGVLLSRDLESMKLNIHKVQCVLPPECDEAIKRELKPISFHRKGKLVTLTARGEEDAVMAKLSAMEPLFLECLPLSLEEIFISETEVVGYDIKHLIQ